MGQIIPFPSMDNDLKRAINGLTEEDAKTILYCMIQHLKAEKVRKDGNKTPVRFL